MRTRLLFALGKVYVVFALALASPSALTAQEDRLAAGIVVDEHLGKPIEAVAITLSGPVDRTVTTDGAGRWRAELPAGSYAARFVRPGYVSRSLSLELPAPTGLASVSLEPSALPLDALVVTAGRRSQALADVAVTTELVTRSEIRASGASDLASVLVERTGVQLQGGHPTGAGLMLQGMGSERILVLLDGQPWIGRLSGNVDVSRIPTSIVERVEIVKGPQATLYGSEAMGGVVNVLTLGPGDRGWGASGSWSAGTEGRLDGSVTADGTLAGTSVWLALGSRAENLVPGRAERLGAAVARRDLGLKLGRRFGGSELRVSGFLVDEDQRWVSGQLYQFADNVQWSGRLAARWELGRHTIRPAVHLSGFDHLSRRGPTSRPPAERTGSRQLQRLAEAELLWGWNGTAWSVDGGVEVSREELAAESVRGGERAATTVDPFAQVTLRRGALTLVPGIRLAWSDVWGAHGTPRLAALWRSSSGLALRASVGAGYRAPGSKELYFEFLNSGPGFSYLVRGNTDLRPESSTNLTAGLEWTGARLYTRVQLFHNRYRDFIETRSVADSGGIAVYTYGNVADGTTRGAELEGGWVLPDFSLEAGWSILDATDAATGKPLLGRPRTSGRLSARTDLPADFRALLTVVRTGRTPIGDADPEAVERAAFTRVDVGISRELTPGVTLALGVDNALDELPDAWPGYAGRRFHLTLEAGHRWTP